MGKFKEAPLGERLGSAAAARQAALARFQARTTEDDPAVAARRAVRQAIASARTIRLAEREAERAVQEEARIARDAAAMAEEVRRREIAAGDVGGAELCEDRRERG